MRDALYVIMTIAFFALMLAYVRRCETIAHEQDPDGEPRP